ncbi:hypothetical protein [Prosthecobacter sp.]|uniref:hypothetical protein n=1 Tax=Prosthecobacter sp. TaxID=1965333 RepID=UPI003783D48D
MTALLSEWSPSRPDWFRDEHQLERVLGALHSRFADVRDQEECRYLMRLWWHLDSLCQQVSYKELHEFVSAQKMRRLDQLFDLMAARNYDAIDSWVARSTREMIETLDR